jgi:uncharacterized protein YecE (DUF72 family)
MFSSGSTNRAYIGTSGWSYDHWKEVFYEKGCSKSNWLKFYAKYFDSVELNSSFYRSIPYATYENWREITPNGFIWSVKANRYIRGADPRARWMAAGLPADRQRAQSGKLPCSDALARQGMALDEVSAAIHADAQASA